MSKYRVIIPYACFVTIEVEAGSEIEAEEIAWEDAGISGFCGNGGSDKLIGVYGSNVSIEASEEPLESGGFSVEVEAIQ